MCPYMTHPYLQHRLTFLGYGFVISVAAFFMLMGRYYFPYLMCGMATFPLMGRSCPFILARNRMKPIMCKPKLKLWIGKMQAKLTCGGSRFCDPFSAQWWKIRAVTAVALNQDSKFVISFSERVDCSFLPRQFSSKEEIKRVWTCTYQKQEIKFKKKHVLQVRSSEHVDAVKCLLWKYGFLLLEREDLLKEQFISAIPFA